MLFLIRHGQTEWNRQGRVQGHQDIPLNERGIEQARAVGRFLKNHSVVFSAIYSSDLKRAHQTAHEIAHHLSLAITTTPLLREGCYGKVEGLTAAEIYTEYKTWDLNRLPIISGIESVDGAVARAKGYLIELTQCHENEHIVVVTHGGVIERLIAHFGYDLNNLPAITNDSITKLVYSASQEQPFMVESIRTCYSIITNSNQS